MRPAVVVRQLPAAKRNRNVVGGQGNPDLSQSVGSVPIHPLFGGGKGRLGHDIPVDDVVLSEALGRRIPLRGVVLPDGVVDLVGVVVVVAVLVKPREAVGPARSGGVDLLGGIEHFTIRKQLDLHGARPFVEEVEAVHPSLGATHVDLHLSNRVREVEAVLRLVVTRHGSLFHAVAVGVPILRRVRSHVAADRVLRKVLEEVAGAAARDPCGFEEHFVTVEVDRHRRAEPRGVGLVVHPLLRTADVQIDLIEPVGDGRSSLGRHRRVGWLVGIVQIGLFHAVDDGRAARFVLGQVLPFGRPAVAVVQRLGVLVGRGLAVCKQPDRHRFRTKLAIAVHPRLGDLEGHLRHGELVHDVILVLVPVPARMSAPVALFQAPGVPFCRVVLPHRVVDHVGFVADVAVLVKLREAVAPTRACGADFLGGCKRVAVRQQFNLNGSGAPAVVVPVVVPLLGALDLDLDLLYRVDEVQPVLRAGVGIRRHLFHRVDVGVAVLNLAPADRAADRVLGKVPEDVASAAILNLRGPVQLSVAEELDGYIRALPGIF